MLPPEDILARLPADDGDEPKSLRGEIIDELRDHLSCAMEEECRGTDEQTARINALNRFGNPQLVALELWRIAMSERITRERFMLGAVSLLLLTQILFITALFVWVLPKLGASETLKEDNQKILAALNDLKEDREKSSAATAQSEESKFSVILGTEDEVQFQGAYFRVVRVNENDAQDENDDDVEIICRSSNGMDEITLEEYRLENVLGGEFTITANSIIPSKTPGEGRANLTISHNFPLPVATEANKSNERGYYWQPYGNSSSAKWSDGTYTLGVGESVEFQGAKFELSHIEFNERSPEEDQVFIQAKIGNADAPGIAVLEHQTANYDLPTLGKSFVLNVKSAAAKSEQYPDGYAIIRFALVTPKNASTGTESDAHEAEGGNGHAELRNILGPDKIIAELPVIKDCMVLQYLPDWAYGNVDNIAFANNDGGVRTYFDWDEIPGELLNNKDYRFYVALYSRKATLGENPGDVLIFPATEEWAENTSWKAQPALSAQPRFRLGFRPREGWKLYNITDIVRSPENKHGACIRFENEDVKGPAWSGHAFVATEAQPEWKGFEPVVLVLNEPMNESNLRDE